MSRLQTRANNKDKHPGVVDLSPQRRTQTKKRVDDERTVEEKQFREEARKATIRRLAEIEQQSTQKVKALMAPGSGPRGVGQKVHGGGPMTAPSTASSPAMGTGKCAHAFRTHTDVVLR
jgi:hypothetical protein